MKNSTLTQHIEQLGDEMKQKRVVIERFLSEMQVKNEQIDLFKKQYKEQADAIGNYEVH